MASNTSGPEIPKELIWTKFSSVSLGRENLATNQTHGEHKFVVASVVVPLLNLNIHYIVRNSQTLFFVLSLINPTTPSNTQPHLSIFILKKWKYAQPISKLFASTSVRPPSIKFWIIEIIFYYICYVHYGKWSHFSGLLHKFSISFYVCVCYIYTSYRWYATAWRKIYHWNYYKRINRLIAGHIVRK
jgi:hypothetical protein